MVEEFYKEEFGEKVQDLQEWTDFMFEDCDVDHNGSISFQEFQNFITQRRIKLKMQFDKALSESNHEDIEKLMPQIRNLAYVHKCLEYFVMQNKMDKHTLEILLDKKADPNHLINEQFMLHQLYRNNLQDCIELILTRKANPNLVDEKNKTVLEIELEKEEPNLEILKLMAGCGASIKSYLDSPQISREIIELLLNHKADPNTTNSKCETLMHWECTRNEFGISTDFLRFLIEKKCDANLKDSNQDSCAMKLTRINVPILNALFSAQLDTSSILHLLMLLSEMKNASTELIQIFIDNKIDFNQIKSEKTTFSHFFFNKFESENQRKFCLDKMLEDPKFDVNQIHSFGTLLLSESTKSNFSERIIRILLEKKADPNLVSTKTKKMYFF